MAVQEYTEESLKFMDKLVRRSGVGNEAYLQDGASLRCKPVAVSA